MYTLGLSIIRPQTVTSIPDDPLTTPLIDPVRYPEPVTVAPLVPEPVDLGPGWEGWPYGCPNPVLVEAGPGLLKMQCPEPIEDIPPEEREAREAPLQAGPGKGLGLLLLIGLAGAAFAGRRRV